MRSLLPQGSNEGTEHPYPWRAERSERKKEAWSNHSNNGPLHKPLPQTDHCPKGTHTNLAVLDAEMVSFNCQLCITDNRLGRESRREII